ncbi:MAG: hypothetical protein KC431_28350, partial [Myxococcales bacterium]|nr:hypothetical protein [Myxococcales bacterium]
MAKHVLALALLDDGQDARVDEFPEVLRELAAITLEGKNRAKQRRVELAANDAGDLQDQLWGLLQPVNTTDDQALERVGELE